MLPVAWIGVGVFGVALVLHMIYMNFVAACYHLMEWPNEVWWLFFLGFCASSIVAMHWWALIAMPIMLLVSCYAGDARKAGSGDRHNPVT